MHRQVLLASQLKEIAATSGWLDWVKVAVRGHTSH